MQSLYFWKWDIINITALSNSLPKKTFPRLNPWISSLMQRFWIPIKEKIIYDVYPVGSLGCMGQKVGGIIHVWFGNFFKSWVQDPFLSRPRLSLWQGQLIWCYKYRYTIKQVSTVLTFMPAWVRYYIFLTDRIKCRCCSSSDPKTWCSIKFDLGIHRWDFATLKCSNHNLEELHNYLKSYRLWTVQ
jgi:hypothetical protein